MKNIDICNCTLSFHVTSRFHFNEELENHLENDKNLKNVLEITPFYVKYTVNFQWIDYRALQIIEDYLRR